MTVSDSKSLPCVGFLTVREFQELGLIGGYLVLNTVGRPLEFHCTAPVRPNRAQEILYGPTLAPFLYGEQIGQALVNKSRTKPLFVCTDVVPVLSLRDHVKFPVLLLAEPAADEASEPEPQTGSQFRVDRPHQSQPPAPKAPQLRHFKLDEQSAAVAVQHLADQELVRQRWQPHSGNLSLHEPFVRLSEAIDEAQGGANR